MNAYTVVGPTNVKPRRFRSFDRAIDSGVVAIVARMSRVMMRGRDARIGSNRHT